MSRNKKSPAVSGIYFPHPPQRGSSNRHWVGATMHVAAVGPDKASGAGS